MAKGGAWREVGGGEAFILELQGRHNDGRPTGSAKPVVRHLPNSKDKMSDLGGMISSTCDVGNESVKPRGLGAGAGVNAQRGQFAGFPPPPVNH